MKSAAAVLRIPDDELAEHWFGFKQNILGKLQTAFRACNLKQEDIAVRLGKDPATISRCLRGKRDMNLRTMHDLARGMNCRLRVEIDHLDELQPANRQPKRDLPKPKVIEDGKPAVGSPESNQNTMKLKVDA